MHIWNFLIIKTKYFGKATFRTLCIFILYSDLRLGLHARFPWSFPTNILYAFLIFVMRTTRSTRLILYDLTILSE
jgi:hypothetical protein